MCGPHASLKTTQPAKNNDRNRNMITLNVPFSEKDLAKSLGAKWNPTAQKWVASTNSKILNIGRWLGGFAFEEPHTIVDFRPGYFSSSSYSPWQFLAPRIEDPKELLSLLDRKLSVRPAFFCGMCDSDVSEDWVFDGRYPLINWTQNLSCVCNQNTLKSLSNFSIGFFRPSEMQIILNYLKDSNVEANKFKS